MLTFLSTSLIVLTVLLLAAVVAHLIVTVKGIVTNVDTGLIVTVIIFSISFILIMIGIMLISNPQSVYVSVRWSWIVLIGIFAPIILFLISLLSNVKYFSAVQLLLSISIFVMMICGIKLAPNTTYEIAKAEDINLLNNLPSPSGKTYYFEVVDDIDFDGFVFKESYGIPDSYIIIEGNGYTWSNINYEVTEDSYEVTFLDLCIYASNTQYSKIFNLSIINSTFSIIPNNYDEKKHEGRPVDFELLDEAVRLENVVIDVTVYIGEAEANIRSDSLSYVDEIYPESGYDKENNVDINVYVVKP